MSKRIHIFTASDVSTHDSASSCWISHAGKVYDVTHFLQDHPGGDDLILQYAGKDVEEAMRNKDEHEHSEAAYEMLQEYLVGRIGSEETTVSDGVFPLWESLSYIFTYCWIDWEATDDFHPEETNEAKDYEKSQFLDLRRPLLRQVWEANFRWAA